MHARVTALPGLHHLLLRLSTPPVWLSNGSAPARQAVHELRKQRKDAEEAAARKENQVAADADEEEEQEAVAGSSKAAASKSKKRKAAAAGVSMPQQLFRSAVVLRPLHITAISSSRAQQPS